MESATVTKPGRTATGRRSSHLSPSAVAWAAAGAFWAVGQGVLPDMGTTAQERLANVAAQPSMQALSAACLFLAGGLLVVAAMSGLQHLPEGRGRRLVTAGLYLTALGGVWLAAGRAAFNLELLGIVDSGVPVSAATAVLDAPDSVAFVALVVTLPCLLIGPALVAAGLARAGDAPWLVLLLWVLGIGVFVATEFQSKVGEVSGIVLAALALALVGLRLASVSARAGRTGSGRAG